MVTEVGATSLEHSYDNDEVQRKQTIDANQEELVELEHEKENEGYPNAFSINIITKLHKAPPENRESYIYRVDDSLRLGNENHYEPLLFSIGPYNREKSKLKHMEKYKWQSLKRMTEKVMEKGGISISVQINKYYEVLKGLEDDARAYYAESISLEQDDFLEMLLFDGCFLIETFPPKQSEFKEYDFSLHDNMAWVIDILRHDLLLLENQLPFFVLNKLCEAMMTLMIRSEEYNPLSLLNSAVKWAPMHNYIRPPALAIPDSLINMISADLILDMSPDHQQVLRQRAKNRGILHLPEIDPEKLQNTKHLLDLAYIVLLREDFLDVNVATKIISIRETSIVDTILNAAYFNTYSVTELSNAGVKFKTVTDRKFYDIQFNNGTLEIPVIAIVGDQTEGLLRNLIAYERCSSRVADDKRRILCDYICFMDGLINSGKDVELLRIHGIIEHSLGDDEAVSTMFNKMGTIVESSLQYYYTDTVKSLKHHCTKKRNIWMAKLRSDYFNSPWTIISVIAAFLLLVLTIIQAVYSPLSYYKG